MHYIIILLQAYCLYHAYTNRRPLYWYFIVLLIPVFGSLIYLITQVYNRAHTEKIQEEIVTVLHPEKKINQLKAQLSFTDTYANRIELADAYFENKDIKNAIEHYKQTLKDTVQDNLYARQKLILCYFQLKEYAKVIEHAECIKERSEFKESKQQFCYGLALNEFGKVEEAEAELKQIDRPYSNYAERLALAKFYVENDKTSKGKELLTEISTESQRLTKPNRKLYSATIVEVERMLASL